MDLFVIRHAPAVEHSPERDDFARPLSPEGMQKFTFAARGLAALGVDFDLLLVSPALRAQQTADLLVPETVRARRSSDALWNRPGAALLAEFEGERVGVVGHEPWLSELACTLVHGDPSSGYWQLKKGATIWLAGEPRPGGMSLLALWTPRALRLAGGADA